MPVTILPLLIFVVRFKDDEVPISSVVPPKQSTHAYSRFATSHDTDLVWWRVALQRCGEYQSNATVLPYTTLLQHLIIYENLTKKIRLGAHACCLFSTIIELFAL